MTRTALSILNGSLTNYFERDSVDDLLILGENVNVGSYISGLTAFLKDKQFNNGRIINMPNIESITGGICFGWNLIAGPTFLFIKQFDFITLYLDDLIHTRNMFDRLEIAYNINLFTFLVDTRLEGAQSSLRKLGEFNALVEVKIIEVTYVSEIPRLVSLYEEYGIKLFVLSQKYAKKEFPGGKPVKKVSRQLGDVFEGFEVYSKDFLEHPLPMVLK